MEEWERLLDELRTKLAVREQELQLLHAVDLRLLSEEQQPEELFSFIGEQSRKLLQADHVTILLRRGAFLEPIYSSIESVVGQRIPISDSLAGLCLENNSAIEISDLEDSPLKTRYVPLRGYAGPPTRSLLAAPIRIRDTVAGVLNAESGRTDAFKSTHESFSAALAAQIAIALQRTQLLASTALFADIDRMALSIYDPRSAIQTALRRVMDELQRLEHVPYSGAQIMFLRGQDELEIVHSTHAPDVGLIVPVDRSIPGRAIRERRTVIVSDVRIDPDYERILGRQTYSEIAIPIRFSDDLLIGVLNVESEEAHAFSGFYQVVLESFAAKVQTLLAFAKLRSDVTEALELRNADDLLVAIGDQTSHMIHRINSTVGAMRMRILELEGILSSGQQVDQAFLQESVIALRKLAERALQMPEEVTRLLGADGATIDINECVRQALLRRELPPDVTIELSLDEDIPPLALYNFDIVVQNLIQNALDAIRGHGEVAITTALVRPLALGGYVQLAVRDNGSGIPADIQERLFELNFSTKRGEERGLGFGLWWVRNFVRRARGDITVRSAVGEGTEMIVKIPLERMAADGVGNANDRA